MTNYVRAWRTITSSRKRPTRSLTSGSKGLLLLGALALIAARAWPAMSVVVLGGAGYELGQVPPDWHVREHVGKASVRGCTENEKFCVHLVSENSSFSLERSVDLNPADLPYLAWTWKVTQIPETGDFRARSKDDQAAQLLIAFSDHRVLTYIWDSNAPKGTMRRVRSIPLVKVFAVVCESGPAEMNRWLTETRNLASDYEHAFGRPAPQVKGLRLQINSQHTGGKAESYFGRVAFLSMPE